MDSVKLPFIKAGSQIPVVISSSIVGDLQTVLSYLIGDKTEDQMVAIQQKIEKREQLEGWEIGIVTLTRLLKDIQASAESNNMIEYKELKDVITSITQ